MKKVMARTIAIAAVGVFMGMSIGSALATPACDHAVKNLKDKKVYEHAGTLVRLDCHWLYMRHLKTGGQGNKLPECPQAVRAVRNRQAIPDLKRLISGNCPQLSSAPFK